MNGNTARCSGGAGSTVQGEILHISSGGEIKPWTQFIVEINTAWAAAEEGRELTYLSLTPPKGSGWITIRLGCLSFLVKSWKMVPWSKGKIKIPNKPYSDICHGPPFCSKQGWL